MGELVYGPTRVVSYTRQVIQILMDAGLNREEIWPMVSPTRPNLEKGLKKLPRKELLEPVLSSNNVKVSEKIDFRK